LKQDIESAVRVRRAGETAIVDRSMFWLLLCDLRALQAAITFNSINSRWIQVAAADPSQAHDSSFSKGSTYFDM